MMELEQYRPRDAARTLAVRPNRQAAGPPPLPAGLQQPPHAQPGRQVLGPVGGVGVALGPLRVGPQADAVRPALPVVRLQFDPVLAPTILPATAETTVSAILPLVLPAPAAPPLAQPAAAATVHTSVLSVATMPSTRPAEGDFLPYAASYINLIPAGTDPLTALRTQPAEIHAVFAGLSESQTEKAYAPGKWTLKEMLLHQIDSERVFAYRAMRFARGDSQNLPGFEQDDYVANSAANARSTASLLAEYDVTRAATLALFESFTEEQLNRRGTANGGPTTVRALLYIVPGHERHHLSIIRERYLPIL